MLLLVMLLDREICLDYSQYRTIIMDTHSPVVTLYANLPKKNKKQKIKQNHEGLPKFSNKLLSFTTLKTCRKCCFGFRICKQM